MPFRRKDSPYWWYDFQIKGRRYSGSTETTDFEDAKAVEAEARMAAKEAAKAAAAATHHEYTIGQALGTYYDEVSIHQASAATTESQAASIIAHIDPDTLISALTQSDLVTLMAKQRAHVANATANRRMELLGRACRYMVKNHDGRLGEVDFSAARVKEPAERIRELSMEEQERLLDSLRPDLVPFVQFSLMTGARRETIENLRWKDVDLSSLTMHFWVKGDRPQSFPISPQLKRFLESLPRAHTLPAAAYVFTLVHQKTLARQQVNRNTFNSAWRSALKNAKIENFRVHDLRHTFATRTLRQSQNLKLVSILLGHKDLQTTMKYAHVLDQDLRIALSSFDPLNPGESHEKSHATEKNV